MNTTFYKITLRNLSGAAYAMYEDGCLSMFLNELERNGPELFMLMPNVCMSELHLKGLTGITVQQLQPKTVADKVALFCLKYKQHKGQPYRAMKEEKANLKTVTVTNVLLDAYFTNDNYPLNTTKSMADYVRHYNTIRDLAANGRPVKRVFPDVYDREYERRIGDDVVKLQAYWQHLRNIGWYKSEGVWTRNNLNSNQ